MKKLVSIVLALALVLASCAVAFAAGENLTITVENAKIGATYTLYKLLDATVDGEGAISYEGGVPEGLEGVLEEVTEGGYTFIRRVAGQTDAAYFAALNTFATTALQTKENIQTTPVEFTGLDAGYYLIKSSAGDKFIVTSTIPSESTVYEKNTSTIEVGKTAGDNYTIGDTITYTVTFNGQNYRGEGSNAKIVTKYVVNDTLPEFLSNVTVTGISINGVDKTVNNTNFPGVESFGTNKTFDIPWATGTHEHYTSLYPDDSPIVITYTATLTQITRIEGADKNVVTIVPYVDSGDTPGPWEETITDHHEVYTYAGALEKVDGGEGAAQKHLAGAKFKFYGVTLTLEPGYTKGVYRIQSVTSGSTTLGTEVEVGDDGYLYILGLAKGVSITGKETVAPAGYNLATGDVTITGYEMGHETWSSTDTYKYDADGNLIDSSHTEHHTEEHTGNIEGLKADAAKVTTVVNQAGTELPSTGGIGTTIFYIVGGILLIGAAVILVARRKASEK